MIELRDEQPVEARLLVTVEEAARLLSIGRSRAYELVAAGEIPSMRLGRSVRVSVDGLRAWINARVSAPTTLAEAVQMTKTSTDPQRTRADRAVGERW